jgi:hypothetical protein
MNTSSRDRPDDTCLSQLDDRVPAASWWAQLATMLLKTSGNRLDVNSLRQVRWNQQACFDLMWTDHCGLMLTSLQQVDNNPLRTGSHRPHGTCLKETKGISQLLISSLVFINRTDSKFLLQTRLTKNICCCFRVKYTFSIHRKQVIWLLVWSYVTLSVYQHRAGLKNMPGNGGLFNGPAMIFQYDLATPPRWHIFQACSV